MSTATREFEPGLDVLNAYEGHMEIRYDKESPEDVERTRKIINDMINRGYAIFVETKDGKTRRVKRFDVRNDAYIVEDVPEEAKVNAPKKVKEGEWEPVDDGRKKKRRTREVKVPRRKAKATGVAPTAGG
jgi:hypothetical protein